MTEGAGRLFYNLRPKGATITLGPKGRCPLSEAMQPFYTTRGASRAPFPLICGEAATTTFGPKGRQPLNLLNLLNLLNPGRGAAPSH